MLEGGRKVKLDIGAKPGEEDGINPLAQIVKKRVLCERGAITGATGKCDGDIVGIVKTDAIGRGDHGDVVKSSLLEASGGALQDGLAEKFDARERSGQRVRRSGCEIRSSLWGVEGIIRDEVRVTMAT